MKLVSLSVNYIIATCSFIEQVEEQLEMEQVHKVSEEDEEDRNSHNHTGAEW